MSAQHRCPFTGESDECADYIDEYTGTFDMWRRGCRQQVDAVDEYRCDVEKRDRDGEESDRADDESLSHARQRPGSINDRWPQGREYRVIDDEYRDTRDMYRDILRRRLVTSCLRGEKSQQIEVDLVASIVPNLDNGRSRPPVL